MPTTRSRWTCRLGATCAALLALLAAPRDGVAQGTSFAVLPIENQQSFGLDQQSLTALGGGIAEIMGTDLAQGGATAAPRKAVAEAIGAQSLGKSGRIDAATAAAIGKAVGARYVVMGNFVDYYGKFRLNVRIVDALSGAILKAYTNENPSMQDREQIYLISETISQRILKDLGFSGQPAPAIDVPSAAVIAFSLGLQAEDGGNKSMAATLYQRALQVAPAFPEAQQALKRVGG